MLYREMHQHLCSLILPAKRTEKWFLFIFFHKKRERNLHEWEALNHQNVDTVLVNISPYMFFPQCLTKTKYAAFLQKNYSPWQSEESFVEREFDQIDTFLIKLLLRANSREVNLQCLRIIKAIHHLKLQKIQHPTPFMPPQISNFHHLFYF